jgi:hypothetical protein
MKRRFLPIRLIRSLPAAAGNPRLLFSRTKNRQGDDGEQNPEQRTCDGKPERNVPNVALKD